VANVFRNSPERFRLSNTDFQSFGLSFWRAAKTRASSAVADRLGTAALRFRPSGIRSLSSVSPMITQTPPTPSPVPGVVLILAVWGAVVDWRYKRKGGKKSSKKDGLLFLAALGVVVVFFAVWAVIGVGDVAGTIGETSPFIAIVLFATWELGRWRARRKNPISQGRKTPLNPGEQGL
jgi:hypothetical protein